MTVRALVVDNNPVLLRAISAILQQEGCVVQSASNGLEALEILKGFIPDIVFTDLIMPQVSGEQLCRIIRNTRELAGTYLVVVSAIVMEDLESIQAENFCDLLIAKGTLGEMRAGLRKALKGCRASSGEGGGDQPLATHIPDGARQSEVARELISERKHLKRVLDNLAEGIVEISPKGVITSLNGAALRILGKREEQLVGSLLKELNWGQHQVRIERWLANHLGKSQGDLLRIMETEPLILGDRVVTALLVPVKDERSPFGLCILRDISRQYFAEAHERQLNEAVRLISKMEAMSSMAGGIAHDFNNLLTVICGNLDMLCHMQGETLSANGGAVVEQARKAAYMAVDLTRTISSSSPFGIISRQQVVLNDLVDEAVKEFGRNHRLSIEVEYGRQRSLVSVSPEQIATVLTNLLHNAEEAGGNEPVKIGVADVDFAAPQLLSGQYVPAGEYVCLAISDAGRGISRENLLKIFDPYYSTKTRGASKGTGLGLTVVYATIRNHGGYVVVESGENQGTTVSCYLPRYLAIHDMGDNGHDPLSRCQVLLVEEDEQMREVGRIMLTYIGCRSEIVSDLPAAVCFLEQEESPWLVLIDPEQLDGTDHLELTGRLMNTRRCQGVIATGSALLGMTMSNHMRYGYANILLKPYSLDSMRHVLTRTIAR